ncbi:MAG: TetR family transcriptional regulator [Anaerolineaceae bacterium]
MAYPARLSQDQILTEARSLLEEHGPAGLTMRALARRLGVSAPSLYFHVESREDLTRLLVAEGLTRFGAVQRAAAAEGSASERARGLAKSYIAFAEAERQLFTLIFGPCSEAAKVDNLLVEEASAPLLQLAMALVGPERALFFAEGLWSLVHGYTVLRLAAQFRMNPEHEAGFWYSLDVLLAGAQVAAPGSDR